MLPYLVNTESCQFDHSQRIASLTTLFQYRFYPVLESPAGLDVSDFRNSSYLGFHDLGLNPKPYIGSNCDDWEWVQNIKDLIWSFVKTFPTVPSL